MNTTTGLFFMSGALSSVLAQRADLPDLRANLAAERAGVGPDLGALAAHAPELLAAISIGAVFMGANTYIGNGPNLLVKAVAESAGTARVAMPNFFAYAGLATAILSPVYIAVALFILA